jgi:hypothetical protein
MCSQNVGKIDHRKQKKAKRAGNIDKENIGNKIKHCKIHSSVSIQNWNHDNHVSYLLIDFEIVLFSIIPLNFDTRKTLLYAFEYCDNLTIFRHGLL